MDWKFWTPLAINLIGVGLAFWQVRIMKQQITSLPSPRSAVRLTRERKLLKKLYIPVFLMVTLVLLSWLPYVLAGSVNSVLPNMTVAWGGSNKGVTF